MRFMNYVTSTCSAEDAINHRGDGKLIDLAFIVARNIEVIVICSAITLALCN